MILYLTGNTVYGILGVVVIAKKITEGHIMEISQLECFLAVEKHGSMNLAAQALFCSQSKVSNSIKELEEELGRPLFMRTNKGVQPTSFGRELVPYARAVITQISQLQDMYRQKGKSGTMLKICCNNFNFATLAATELYSRHKDEKLNITMRDCSRTECIESVANRYAELAVIRIWNYQLNMMNKHLRTQKLEFFPLCIMPASIAVGPNNPLFSKEDGTVKPSELNPFPTIVFDYTMYNPNIVIYEMFKDLEVNNIFSVTSSSTLRDILLTTDAYFLTCGSSKPGSKGLHNFADCRVLELKDCDITGHIGYIKQSDQNLSSYGREYVDIITDYLQTI